MPHMIRIARRGGLALSLACGLAACSIDPPEKPELDVQEGFTLIEGHPRWGTNSVSWKDSASGTSQFAFIAVSRDVLSGRTHFLYNAAFSLGCAAEDCFPVSSVLFVESGLTIFNLDWSPRGSLAVFEGKMEREPGFWIYTYAPGGQPRRWVTGFEPTFSADASLVFYVESGRDRLRAFNPASGGGFVEREALQGAAYPRLSTDGRFMAYSAQDGSNGQRIFVYDRQNPTFFARPVSDPDRLPNGSPGRDGVADDYPAWSPHGRYLAYRGKIISGTLRDAIFITVPAAQLQNPRELVSITPGRQVTYLRWHRSGLYLLVIIDGDVYAYTVPETYRDL